MFLWDIYILELKEWIRWGGGVCGCNGVFCFRLLLFVPLVRGCGWVFPGGKGMRWDGRVLGGDV